MKKNALSNFVLPFLFGILLVFISLFFCFYSPKFSNPFPIQFLKYSGKTVHIVEFSDMQSLYFSLAVGIPGIYLTMLSILLNARQNLSIGTFFKYVINKSIILLLTLFILLCFFNLILPYLKLTQNSAFFFQIISVIELFIFAIISFKTLLFIENPKFCAKLCKRNCIIKKEVDKDESEQFYFSFIRPAFQDNSFSVFEAIKEMESSDKNEKFYDYEILNNLLDNLEFKTDLKVLLNGLKKIAEYITFYSGNICYKNDTSEKTLKALQKYEELYFLIYERLFYCNGIKYPYILEAAQFLRNYLTLPENKSQEKFYNSICNIYSKILASAKRMVILSVYKCDSVNVHSHIADFMNLSQGLEFNDCEENQKLLEIHEHFFIDILTHLINLIQMQRIDKNNLIFVFRGLNHIRKIRITNGDFDFYSEILPSVGWSNVVYSKNYYLTLLLVLCKNKNDFLYKETLKKIYYQNNSVDELKTLYKILEENLKKITEDDLNLIVADEKILNSLDSVKKDVKSKLDEIKQSELNSLMNYDTANGLDIAVKNVKDKLKANFSSLWKENLKTDNSMYFPFRIEFTVSQLKNGKYEQNYTFITNLLSEVVCNQFIKTAEQKTIGTINEIPNLENQKEIFVSSKAFDLLIADKNAKFNGQQIEINGKCLNVHFVSQEENYILTLDEINKVISITDITDFQDKAEKFIRNDDVIVSVLFHLIIGQKKSKGKAYILG